MMRTNIPLGLVARCVSLAVLAVVLPAQAQAASPTKAPPAAAAEAPKSAPAAGTEAEEAKPFAVLIRKDGTRFELKGKSVVVGSGPGADVVIEDQTISPKHARFHNAGSSVTLEDLGGKFGTLAAGTAVTKGKPFRILQPIDIALGANLFRFEFGVRPSTLEPTQQAPGAGRGKGTKPATAGKKSGNGKSAGKGK